MTDPNPEPNPPREGANPPETTSESGAAADAGAPIDAKAEAGEGESSPRGGEGDAAGAEHTAASESANGEAEGADGAPKRKRKRRRRRRKKKPEEGEATPEAAAQGATPSEPASAPAEAAPPPAPSAAVMNLAAGLLSHVDDRQVACKVDGCDRTWTWTAQEQIQNYGAAPPRRMCARHAEAADKVQDQEVTCANPGCDKTWTWTRSAQLQHLSRTKSDKAPSRVCDDCNREEKSLADREVRCRVDGCKRRWTWSADAQLKHRHWLRKSGGEGGGDRDHDAGGGKGKRRRRGKRSRGSIHDPPPRMCEPCRAKLARLSEREGPCKVHGCTRNAAVDRDSQLRAWAAMGTDNLDAEPVLPRRMCEVCREFCRHHPDRKIACGRPGCRKTWTHKTGAQLQAFLAGRLEDPIRLCNECLRGDFVNVERPAGAPAGAEIMPCVVRGCDGVWYWLPGTTLQTADHGDLPPDRMCAEHRRAHGAPASAEGDTAAASATATPKDAEPSSESADSATAETVTPASAEGTVEPTVPAVADEIPSQENSPSAAVTSEVGATRAAEPSGEADTTA